MTKRVLPPDVYDALELSALVFGGIGAGQYREDYGTPNSPPVCAVGHVSACAPSLYDMQAYLVCWGGMVSAGIDEPTNDKAVHRINRRLGNPRDSRVTFKQWCKELGVIRGASTENTK